MKSWNGKGAAPIFAAALAGLLAAGAPGGAARAQDAEDVARIAQYQGEDRSKMLEDGARAEGELLIYSTGTQVQPLIDAFQQKYPFIKVQLYKAGSAEVGRKVYEEYQAGHYVVDGFELASHGLVVPREVGALAPFYSPEAANYPDAAKERGGHWIVVRESYTGLGFNTDLIKPEDAPKTYDDLLDPKWKGKLAMSGTLATVTNWVGMLELTKGDEFVQKLGAQDIRVYDVSGRALANLMISGEVAISPTIYDSHVAESVGKGAPLEWRALGPVPVTATAVAIAARAPHPHAMMLFTDFLLSKEAQEIYGSIGYASARTDMAGKDSPAEKLYLDDRPSYVQDFDTWTQIYMKTFMKAGQ